MRCAGRKPNGRQFRCRPFERIAPPGEFQRHRDVLERRHGRDQVEGLEDDADMAAAKAGKTVLVKDAEILSGDAYSAAVGPLEATKGHQQGRFARAGRADEADSFPLPYFQRNALENMNARAAPLPRLKCTSARSIASFIEGSVRARSGKSVEGMLWFLSRIYALIVAIRRFLLIALMLDRRGLVARPGRNPFTS